MKFNELHQDLKDWLMEDDHTYGTARLVKLLEFIKAEDISNITEYLNNIFNLGVSNGSCKCGGSCGCKENPLDKVTFPDYPRIPDTNPIPPYIPEYPGLKSASMKCPSCGIDLTKNTMYCCMRTDCPSFTKPVW